MIVPSAIAGINYNGTTPARELAVVPDCPPCKPFFNNTGVRETNAINLIAAYEQNF